jgi:hypothetical protein
VDPGAGLNDLGKRMFLTLPGLELRPLGRPARSQSLYPLRYPGSSYHTEVNISICPTDTDKLHSHSDGYDVFYLLGYNAAYYIEKL